MTETKFVGCGGDIKQWIWQYVQYLDGVPVARFKIKEDGPLTYLFK